MNKIIFLDVDGVLNAWANRHADRNTGHTRYTVEGYVLNLRKSDGLRLLATGAQIVWATTWITAPEGLEIIASIVGLPAGLPQIKQRKSVNFYSCGKLDGVRQYLAELDGPVRWAWLDDELGPHDFELVNLTAPHGLAVKTDEILGISDEQFAALDRHFDIG